MKATVQLILQLAPAPELPVQFRNSSGGFVQDNYSRSQKVGTGRPPNQRKQVELAHFFKTLPDLCPSGWVSLSG